MSEPDRRAPNFFLAGVSRSGTTSLHAYLNQHPQIFMSPVKEPTFFGAADLMKEPHRDAVLAAVQRNRAALQTYLAGPQPPVNFRLIVNWDDYLRLFRDSSGEPVRGESSTSYFWLPGAAKAIRDRIPAARLAFILRDPAERVFTLYLQHDWRGERLAFQQWFQSMLDSPRHSESTVLAGRYATHLKRFLDVFPREQLQVHLYDDFRRDPHAVLTALFTFLDVDPAVRIDVSPRRRESVVPRFPRLHAVRQRLFGVGPLAIALPGPIRTALRRLYHARPSQRPMSSSDRRAAVEYYRSEIQEAAELIGRDLTTWLR
jgi:hypothetical protein